MRKTPIVLDGGNWPVCHPCIFLGINSRKCQLHSTCISYIHRAKSISLYSSYRPKRSFGQGYVFTGVCDSVHGGGVLNFSGGVYLPGGYLPGGVYLPGGCTCQGGVPAGGCTCRREGVYLPGGYLPGGMYLPEGGYLPGVYLLGGVPAGGVYLPGGCTCQGGVPARGVYLPGGCTSRGDVPAWGGVPARGGVYLPGGYLPGGYLPGGCTCQGGTCRGGSCSNFSGGGCALIWGGCLLQIFGGGGSSNFRNTVTVRPVRILLECILIYTCI